MIWNYDKLENESLKSYLTRTIEIYLNYYPQTSFYDLDNAKAHLISWCFSNFYTINSISGELLTPRLFVSSIIFFYFANMGLTNENTDSTIEIATFFKLGSPAVKKLFLKDTEGKLITNKKIYDVVKEDLIIINNCVLLLTIPSIQTNLIMFL